MIQTFCDWCQNFCRCQFEGGEWVCQVCLDELAEEWPLDARVTLTQQGLQLVLTELHEQLEEVEFEQREQAEIEVPVEWDADVLTNHGGHDANQERVQARDDSQGRAPG